MLSVIVAPGNLLKERNTFYSKTKLKGDQNLFRAQKRSVQIAFHL